MIIHSVGGARRSGTLQHVDVSGAGEPDSEATVTLEITGRSVCASVPVDLDGAWTTRFDGDDLDGFACGALVAVRAARSEDDGVHVEWVGRLECVPADPQPIDEAEPDAARTDEQPAAHASSVQTRGDAQPVVVIHQPSEATPVSVTVGSTDDRGRASREDEAAYRDGERSAERTQDPSARSTERPRASDAGARRERSRRDMSPAVQARSAEPAGDGWERGARSHGHTEALVADPSQATRVENRPPRRDTDGRDDASRDGREPHDATGEAGWISRPRSEASRRDAPRFRDEPRRERSSRQEATHREAPRQDGPRREAPRYRDASRHDDPYRDEPRHDVRYRDDRRRDDVYRDERRPGGRPWEEEDERYDDAPRYDNRPRDEEEDDAENDEDEGTPWLLASLLLLSVVAVVLGFAAQGYPLLIAGAVGLALPVSAGFASAYSARTWAMWTGIGLGAGSALVAALLPMVDFVQMDTYLLSAAVVAVAISMGIGVLLVFGGQDEDSDDDDAKADRRSTDDRSRRRRPRGGSRRRDGRGGRRARN